jgi:dipeptide/tripeptide permease
MVMAPGEALMIPVMTAGVKLCSNLKQRSMAFSMYYVLMNVGFAIAGWLFDLLRRSLAEYGTLALPGGIEISTYRAILLTSFAITIPAIVFTWIFLREGVEMTEEEMKITPEKPKYAGVNVFVALYRMSKEALQDTVRIFVDIWKQPNFNRFLIYLTLIAFVRLVFYHMHFTFPKYGIRELGEGAPVGNLWGVLNPVTIVIVAPIVGALSKKISSYKMISCGTTISALPVFLLAVPRHVFQPLADSWFGQLIGHTWLHVEGAVDPLYVSITLFVFSIGEAIWSPRLCEYTASIAPKGQAGSYMALSLLPYFVAKLIVGLMSGRLLEAYCPATGPRNSEMLWFIIGAMAIVCPIGIVTLRKYIRSCEEGRDEDVE